MDNTFFFLKLCPELGLNTCGKKCLYATYLKNLICFIWVMFFSLFVYQEGKIIHFDHSTKQIELELLSAYQGRMKIPHLTVEMKVGEMKDITGCMAILHPSPKECTGTTSCHWIDVMIGWSELPLLNP